MPTKARNGINAIPTNVSTIIDITSLKFLENIAIYYSCQIKHYDSLFECKRNLTVIIWKLSFFTRYPSFIIPC